MIQHDIGSYIRFRTDDSEYHGTVINNNKHDATVDISVKFPIIKTFRGIPVENILCSIERDKR